MEPKERRNISTEETKHIAAIGLAIEHAYDIQYAYAVDGSKDEAEAWGDGATGERAAAWGAWDGITAYGGALPPDTDNQEAELYAIERILARHERGDRILLMCDCQAALTTVDGTWQSGRVGTGSPAAGRTGGLLVEAITRHRLRIESRTDDSQPRGCVCFLWVKAHGGGVVPNAYADAIAKSCLTADVDYASVDAPFLALPRACLYATTPTPRDDMWELDGDQYSCIAADKSLRHIIIDGITRHALDRLPKPTQERCDARIVGEVTHMRGRPEGAAPGAPPRRSVTAPTATGGALRLRSNDLRQHVAACPLCLTPGPLEGDHTMRCTALPRALREAAMAKVTAALDAAASALPSGALCTPTENTMQAWKLAARRAGQHGAIAALGPTPDAHHPLKPTSAREWAHRGWKTKADEYALDLGEGAARPDKQLAMWCAIAVCSAHAAAIQAADAVGATAEVASACSAAIQKIEEGPLGTASRAIGHVALNEESGAPDDGGIIYQTHDEGGIDSIRIRFIQLQPHTQGAHLREWSERRSWLPSARAHTGKRTWSAHTHRGFRSEGGAAGRKVEHSVAVDPLDAVYSITAPATWPWRVEYEIHGHDIARPDGTPGQRVQISVRLGYADGAPKARVSARHVRADGRRHRGGDTAIHAEVELAGDMQGLGLRAMFWDVAYGAHAEEHGAQAAVRRATAAAALRCQGGPEGAAWRSLRSVMGGELPPPTPRERLESHLAKRAVGDAAATEAEARVTAKHDAAPPGPAPTHVSTDAERLGEAAEVLGVQIDAPPQEMRRAYLLAALRLHPDKGGSNADFLGMQAAYQLLDGATSTARQGAARELRDAAIAAARARRDTTDSATQRALRLSRAVTQAREEARKRAEAEWVPPWRTAAQHIRTASGAFMDLWTEYQRQVTRKQNEFARSTEGGGYETHGERQAAAAVARRATQRHEREVARRKAVADMREAERRATHARRAAAITAADQMRRRGAAALLEASQVDPSALMQEYRVRVPYALWKGAPDSHLDHYEEYEIEEIGTHWVTLVRSAATAAERRLPIARAGWNRFQVNWDCLTGISRYGPDLRGLEIVPRGTADSTSAEEAETSDEERQLAASEETRAMRRAARLIEEARTADRDAARVLREEARQGGAHTAADEAMQHEDAGDADKDGSDVDELDGSEVGLDSVTDHGAPQTTSARRRGAWSGRNWAREAWTGPVAAAEYAEAWVGGVPPLPPGSAATDVARRAAQQASLEANTSGHKRAVATAVRESSRRTRRLWGAAEDAERVHEQQCATDHLAEFIQHWREREPTIPRPHGTAGTALTAATAAADTLQRHQPAKDTVAAASRKRVLVDAACLIASTGAHRNLTGDTAAARAQQLLRRDAGQPPLTPGDAGHREAVRMLAAVLERLPSDPDGPRAPRLPAPLARGVRAQHTDASDIEVSNTPAVPHRDDANRVEREPPPHIAVHVGNLRAGAREGWRMVDAEDRRVDRGTPLGNPFPIDPTDDRSRDDACAAYAALIKGDQESVNAQEIATRYGLRVIPRLASRKAIRELHRSLRQLEQDTAKLRPGKSIRLMCHCAPKRCHAHVVAHEIRHRLHKRGIHILVDDGGWKGDAAHRADAPPTDDGCDGADADMTATDEGAEGHAGEPDRGNADSISDGGAGSEGRAGATHIPAAPSDARTDVANGQPEPFPELLARLKGHRENRLRNERAITAFFSAFPNPRALSHAHPHSLPAATRSRETNGPGDADGGGRKDGSGTNAAGAAGAMGMRSARQRKSPTAMARVKAAMAKAAAAREARAAKTTTAEATGIAARAAATEDAATTATAVTAKGATVTEAGSTAAEATVTRVATAEKVIAEAGRTAAADGWVRPRDTVGPDDSHEDGTTRVTRQETTFGDEDDGEQAHETDGDAVRDGSGADGTRATRRATGDGGTTDGIKRRGERGGRSEAAHRAKRRKRNDKYGNEAT